MLNRYSMGEHEGYLRVATTDFGLLWSGQESQEEPASNVFVLSRSGQDLDVVGEIRGIAPGEQIYAARFLADRGFLVTFEQIDPLFTLDLSDPTAPALVGELKVPGYSAYLHPVGDDHLLAVGMDGTEDGLITGLAVSLFDVGDMATPALVDSYTLASGDGWSYSEALWDPHAFTYHRDVLAIPAYTWDEGGGFSGLLLLDVDRVSGLTEIGRIDHQDMVGESECLHEGGMDEEPLDHPCDGDYGYAWMRRGLMIEDNVYSISDYGMKVNDLHDPGTEHARVLFWPAS